MSKISREGVENFQIFRHRGNVAAILMSGRRRVRRRESVADEAACLPSQLINTIYGSSCAVRSCVVALQNRRIENRLARSNCSPRISASAVSERLTVNNSLKKSSRKRLRTFLYLNVSEMSSLRISARQLLLVEFFNEWLVPGVTSGLQNYDWTR